MNNDFNAAEADRALNQMRQQVTVQALTKMINTMTEKCFEKCIVKPGSQLTDREKRCLESCATNYNSTMTLVTGAVTKAGNQ